MESEASIICLSLKKRQEEIVREMEKSFFDKDRNCTSKIIFFGCNEQFDPICYDWHGI